jgi:hypothetical protein
MESIDHAQKIISVYENPGRVKVRLGMVVGSTAAFRSALAVL